ncbi:PREDICTED: uncharacterized protein LOC104808598 isoform X2 [Tarenaya hassleriana]|uniref:uncharacterized protein LOC104808598 isoform X2 n=1 Tax=Tarenaya hassleriana TaxID=28532 RepID=UPI00053C7A4F|nr:PREDICTED: uncharacterized protein LOC104808598 isoform X2 [Tarenaya hassleriana]
MGAAVHCESIVRGHYSMRMDLSEDSNSCSWSVRCGDKDPRFRHERDFVKRTMLEHEATFKNQVSELHRLYRVQRTLMEDLRQKELNGGNSQSCDKDQEVVEVRPVKIRRKIIDLQLPAEAYMDTDEISDLHGNLPFPHHERSNSRNILERGNASHQENSSGTCLGLKKLNGFADLNEPPVCFHEAEPVASSKDIYSPHGKNNAHLQGLRLQKDSSQHQRLVREGGHDTSNPFHLVQTFSNSGFQPRVYPSSDHGMAKFSAERTVFELETRLRNPEVSYYSHVESSVASRVPSSHGHGLEFLQSSTHWLSSRANPSSSSDQSFSPVQENPFLNRNNQGRANTSSEIWRRDLNCLYQGSSSRPKEVLLGFPPVNCNHIKNGSNGEISNDPFGAVVKYRGLESLQGPKMHECSTGLSCVKPKLHYRSEITDGCCLDLNASIPQVTDERAEMTDFQSSRKILGSSEKHSIVKEEPSCFTSPSICITGQLMEVNKMVKSDHGTEFAIVDEEESKRATRFRHHIDLNLCASEDEDSGMVSGLRVKRTTPWIDLEAPLSLDSEEEAEKSPEKTKEDPWGLRKPEGRNFIDELLKDAAEAIVSISLSHHRYHHPDEAASSSTGGLVKDTTLVWFAETIASCGDELEKHIEAFSGGGREECSYGEFDYFEVMTLKLAETKEEDYMPKPLVPENLKLDGTCSKTAVPNRPRRGQPRRGRPKRDFQRDILPGLTSLARHEVTEDLQIFGGLMEARGSSSWNPGEVARRNITDGGSSRGRRRRRLVTDINRAPSWGIATKRPRRQTLPCR